MRSASTGNGQMREKDCTSRSRCVGPVASDVSRWCRSSSDQSPDGSVSGCDMGGSRERHPGHCVGAGEEPGWP